jgi:RNA methyltransferase, TrmH family
MVLQTVKNSYNLLMLSKNRTKFIISLQRKKTREEEGLFVIEGDKIVREFLQTGMPVKMLVAKPEFIRSLPADLLKLAEETDEASFEELKKVSTLKTPHNAIAVVRIPERDLAKTDLQDDLCCALEFIQDPGNLGTIIRAAGWFGIQNIICSDDCVDAYNPKVIQASMGAVLHVRVFYTDMEAFLSGMHEKGIHVFGTVLDGEPVYSHPLAPSGIILLGNESKGISANLQKFITSRIRIPGFSNARPGLDSLNVGMAASIVFSEFRRRVMSNE